MKPQITLQCNGRSSSLLENISRNFHKRRAAFGNERRDQLRASAIDHVKRAAVGVEDTRRSFDNQSMQVIGPDRFAEGFPQPVQEIEDERFLDLDFFFRAFQRPYPPGLSLRGVDPPRDGREQESEEKDRPHGHDENHDQAGRDQQPGHSRVLLTSRPSRDEGLALDNQGRP